jgi:type I restriction enzyme S subunit
MSTATTHIDNKASLRASHCEDEGRSKLKQSHTLAPALRFKEFEGEWNKMKLSDVCAKIQDGNYGGSYPKSEEFVEEGIPFLTSKALGGDGVLKENKIDFLPLKKHQELKKAHLKLNDVLFTNRGSNVGSIGFTDERISHGNIGPQLTLLRSDLNIIEPHFLFQIMSSNVIKKQVSSQDSGSAMNFFGIGATSKFKFNIPSLPEQQKIASFLSAVDEKIQQLTNKNALLEDYKKGVMQQLFSGQLRFKDENGEDYPDWEEKRLGEVSRFLDGRRKPIKGGDRSKIQGEYPYYGASGIIDYVNNYIFDEEIILLGEDGENIISRNLPLAFRVSGKCWINNHAHVIKPNDNTDIDFLTYSLERINYEPYNTGTAQPKLNQAVCRSLPLKLPSYPEQQKIATYLSRIDTKIESVNNKITQTQTFKKGLLQQLFV